MTAWRHEYHFWIYSTGENAIIENTEPAPTLYFSVITLALITGLSLFLWHSCNFHILLTPPSSCVHIFFHRATFKAWKEKSDTGRIKITYYLLFKMGNFHGLIKTTVALKVNSLEYFTKCYKLSQTGPFRANRKRAVVCVRPILLAAKGCLCFLERSTTPQTTALGWQTSSEFRHPAWLCHLVSLHDFQPAFAWQPLFLCVRLIQKRTSNPTEQAGAPGDKFA